MDFARLGFRVDSSPLRRGSRDLDEFGRAGRRAGDSASSAGAAIKSAFAAIGTAVAATGITNTIRGFEAGMSRVAAISGATESQFADLRDLARELGSTTEFSATQAADGMQFLSQAGFDAASTLEALPTVLDLATASSVDMGTAADIASNILGGFELQVRDFSGVADVLAATTSKSNTNLVQLGNAMSYAGPLAAAAGIEVEEAAAAIGKLSDAGIQGSRAGTALSGVIRRLQTPSKRAKDAFTEMGIALEDVDLIGEDLADVMGLLAERNLTAAQATAIFEAEAAPGALVLAKNADAVEALTEELEGASGSLTDMASIMRNNIDGAFKGFSSAVEGLVLELGEQGLTQALTVVITQATNFVRNLTELDILYEVATGAGVAAAALVALASPISTIVAGLAVGAVLITNHWEQLEDRFPGLTKSVSDSLSFLGRSFSRVGEFASTAIDAVKLAFSGGNTEAVNLLLSALAHDAKAFALRFASNVVEGATIAVQGIADALRSFEIAPEIESAITRVAEALNDFAGIDVISIEKIGPAIDSLVDFVRRIPDNAGDLLRDISEGFTDFLTGLDAQATTADVVRNLASAIDSLVGFASSVGSIVSSLFSLGLELAALLDIYDPAKGDSITKFLGMLASEALRGASAIIRLVASSIDVLAASIASLLENDWDRLNGALERFMDFWGSDSGGGFFKNLLGISELDEAEVAEKLKRILGSAQQTLSEAEGGLRDRIFGLPDLADIQKIFDAYREGLISASELEKSLADKRGEESFFSPKGMIIDEMLEQLRRLDAEHGAVYERMSLHVETYEGTLQEFATGARSLGEESMAAYADGIAAGASQPLNEVGIVTGALEDTTGALVDSFERAGELAMDGLAEGLKRSADRAANAGVASVRGVVSAMEKELGIASPSRRAMAIGSDFMQGLQIGIRYDQGETDEAAAAAGKSMVSSLAQSLKDRAVLEQAMADASRVAAQNLIGSEQAPSASPNSSAGGVLKSTSSPAVAGAETISEFSSGMFQEIDQVTSVASDIGKDIRDAIEEGAAPTGSITDQFVDSISRSFPQTLREVGNFWDAVKITTKQSLDQIAQDIISSGIRELLGSLFSVGTGGGGGGLFSGLLSSFGGLFADGGNLGAGKWGIAGEAGEPEIVSGPATITPVSKLGGETSIVVNNMGPPMAAREEERPGGGRLITLETAEVMAAASQTPGNAFSRSLNIRQTGPLR